LNFGSLNIDHVYNVDHFVAPGDTFTGYFLAAKLRGMDVETAPAPMGWTTFIKKMV
jgi:hypothetical protein